MELTVSLVFALIPAKKEAENRRIQFQDQVKAKAQDPF
jgi:hypothetical protein